MQEYWHSSLLACERYLNSPNITIDQKLYQGVPNSFKEIRPWVKYGWEMILIVHEIIKTENPLKSDNKDDFINNYHQNCQRILNEKTSNIPCYLADWGYLKESDRYSLGNTIKLIKLANLEELVAI